MITITTSGLSSSFETDNRVFYRLHEIDITTQKDKITFNFKYFTLNQVTSPVTYSREVTLSYQDIKILLKTLIQEYLKF